MHSICTPSFPAWSMYLRVRSTCASRIFSRLWSVLAASEVWMSPHFTIRGMVVSSWEGERKAYYNRRHENGFHLHHPLSIMRCTCRAGHGFTDCSRCRPAVRHSRRRYLARQLCPIQSTALHRRQEIDRNIFAFRRRRLSVRGQRVQRDHPCTAACGRHISARGATSGLRRSETVLRKDNRNQRTAVRHHV